MTLIKLYAEEADSYDREVAGLRADLTLVKWLAWSNFAMTVALVAKAFL